MNEEHKKAMEAFIASRQTFRDYRNHAAALLRIARKETDPRQRQKLKSLAAHFKNRAKFARLW